MDDRARTWSVVVLAWWLLVAALASYATGCNLDELKAEVTAECRSQVDGLRGEVITVCGNVVDEGLRPLVREEMAAQTGKLTVLIRQELATQTESLAALLICEP